MAKETHITTDGATVKTKGQDLIVSPKRLTMFLVAILLGGFGILFLLAFIGGLLASVTAGEWGDVLEMIPLIILAGGSFESITGVYLYHTGNMTFGDISGAVVQTGIVADADMMPITSVSKPKQEDNMADAVMLIRLYAEHLGHDPNVLGKYETLVAVELHPKLPVTFPFESD